MLQEVNGCIQEADMPISNVTLTTTGGNSACYPSITTGNTITIGPWYQPYTWYQSYPVYVCTDKTRKAIDILKMLEADKVVKVTSVPKFIALVEKIAGVL